MLQQHHLLSRRGQQPEPRHTRNVAAANDNNGHCSPSRVGIGFPPRHKCRGFQPKISDEAGVRGRGRVVGSGGEVGARRRRILRTCWWSFGRPAWGSGPRGLTLSLPRGPLRIPVLSISKTVMGRALAAACRKWGSGAVAVMQAASLAGALGCLDHTTFCHVTFRGVGHCTTDQSGQKPRRRSSTGS